MSTYYIINIYLYLLTASIDIDFNDVVTSLLPSNVRIGAVYAMYGAFVMFDLFFFLETGRFPNQT